MREWAQPATRRMSDLRDILWRLGLDQYFQTFIQEGFDTWDALLDITESDLFVRRLSTFGLGC